MPAFVSRDIASSRLSVFSLPSIVRLRSMARGLEKCSLRQAPRQRSAEEECKSSHRDLRLVARRLAFALDLTRQPDQLVAHPLVTLVAIIARMPEQSRRHGGRLECVSEMYQLEIFLQNRRQRGGHREQEVAV